MSLFCGIYALLIYYGKVTSNENTINIVTFIIGIISFMILGLLSGIVAKKNGLAEGMLASLIIILIALLLNLVLKVPFVANNFIKMAAYITSSSVGGIIGVNLRKS
jgi:putative membrane protein (TIGR04086 family)